MDCKEMSYVGRMWFMGCSRSNEVSFPWELCQTL